LILDEINRADLDKIIGPILTWLSSRRPISVGRLSPDEGATAVTLGWSQSPASYVGGADYRAGTDWRLLGTYNAVDAQRVFRFGQALGRRFQRIPVPAPRPTEFAAIADELSDRLRTETVARLKWLYQAHYADGSTDATTRVGPAMFTGMAAYLHQAEVQSGAPAASEFVEAYVAQFGTVLRRLAPEALDELGERCMGAGAFDQSDWDWLCEMLPLLA
jgi:MoxR-like ATPase